MEERHRIDRADRLLRGLAGNPMLMENRKRPAATTGLNIFPATLEEFLRDWHFAGVMEAR